MEYKENPSKLENEKDNEELLDIYGLEEKDN